VTNIGNIRILYCIFSRTQSFVVLNMQQHDTRAPSITFVQQLLDSVISASMDVCTQFQVATSHLLPLSCLLPIPCNHSYIKVSLFSCITKWFYRYLDDLAVGYKTQHVGDSDVSITVDQRGGLLKTQK
jgi:hypothetical protein